jgi:RNA polymerase sigma-70 factor (ECF subfamily)
MPENQTAPADRTGTREQRFEALYARDHQHVFGYVMRRCDRAEDAADAIAETFLVAWRRLDDAPDGDAARLWLYGVARRVLANQRRGERRRLALADRLRSDLKHATYTYTSAGCRDSHREHEALRAAFEGLSPDDREVLALEAWEELDSRQIAKVLGCSSAAARTRLHRARHRLKHALDATMPLPFPSAHPQPKHEPDRPEAIGGGI